MKIDPITQLILEADVDSARDTVNRVGAAAANQAKNKAIKAGKYVASKYRAKFGKKLEHDKCDQLRTIAAKHNRAGGQCNTAKHEYYKHLTHICDDGFRLQAIFTELNTKLMRPKTKAARQEEAKRLKDRILSSKQSLETAKQIMDDKCREEAEKSIEDRAKAKELKDRVTARRKAAKKRKG